MLFFLKIKHMEKKKAKKVAALKKIKIIRSAAGRFGISANVGDVISLEVKQMETMIELGYAVKA